MNRNGNSFVLLAGGGMGAWIWERLVPQLDYPSIAPDKRFEQAPGEPPKPERKADIEDCAKYVARLIEESGADNVILVAHSGAGIIAPRIAELADSVRKIVFVSANIPPAGRSALDMLPLPVRILNAVALMLMSKPDPMMKHEKTIRKHFCNASDEATINFVLSHEMRPEPRGIAFAKRMSGNGAAVPAVFIRLLRDGCATIDMQNRMAANYGTTDFLEIDADHMVMLSAPGKLAEALNGIGKAVFGSPARTA